MRGEIRLVDRRLKFGHPDRSASSSAPFGSAVIVMRPGDAHPHLSAMAAIGELEAA